MTTVKLRCGECGSEGEFPVDGFIDYDDIQRRVLGIHAAWVKIHAPCLEATAADGWRPENEAGPELRGRWTKVGGEYIRTPPLDLGAATFDPGGHDRNCAFVSDAGRGKTASEQPVCDCGHIGAAVEAGPDLPPGRPEGCVCGPDDFRGTNSNCPTCHPRVKPSRANGCICSIPYSNLDPDCPACP